MREDFLGGKSEAWGRTWMDYQMLDLTAFTFHAREHGDSLGFRIAI